MGLIFIQKSVLLTFFERSFQTTYLIKTKIKHTECFGIELIDKVLNLEIAVIIKGERNVKSFPTLFFIGLVSLA